MNAHLAVPTSHKPHPLAAAIEKGESFGRWRSRLVSSESSTPRKPRGTFIPQVETPQRSPRLIDAAVNFDL